MTGLGDIIQALRSLREPMALATLVRVRGSSYRKPGARMLFGATGFQTGGISAGCLETDVKARVETVLESRRPALVTFDMGSDLDLIWGTGMGCQGRADVLVERLEPGQAPPWMAASAALLEARRTGALVTVYAAPAEGLVPVGSRFLWEGDREVLPAPPGLATLLRPVLDRTQGSGIAETSTLHLEGGVLELLVEPLVPPVALWVFGAGEHARPIFRLAKELGWFLGLVDHRPALATQARFPQAHRIVVDPLPEVLEGLPFDARSAALLVSHGFEADQATLAGLLNAPLGYLGLQGNRKRSEKILEAVLAENGPLTDGARAILHYPAGLDLGAESPEIIALSMVSEIQAVLTGRAGLSLRDRPGRIH